MIDNPLKPLVRWMGGKQRLLGPILDTIYESKYTGTYIEPFLGGGSVLLALLPNRAVINDLNGQLVNLWRCVQSDVEAVIDCWNEINTDPVTSDHYYQLRDEHNEYRRNDTSGPRAAAVFAWITRHSFNGLYRTRKDGTVNANWNKEEQSRPLPVDNWREVHRYLRNNDILILQGDFDRVVKMAGGGIWCIVILPMPSVLKRKRIPRLFTVDSMCSPIQNGSRRFYLIAPRR
ncbi:MAG: DNA adenine methylase [Thermoguttaceae bacterium]|nr:DNA adenine methylase [Thermoguttaceae bacterium]